MADFTALMPFAAMLGVEILDAAPEEVVGRLAWRPELCTAGGILHGGALMAGADAVGAVCTFLNLPEGTGGTSTIESKSNFFRPVASGSVLLTSVPVHVGRRTIVVQTDLERHDGKLAARVTQTQAVL